MPQIDLVAPNDPRARLSLTFHPAAPRKQFTVTIPRFDYMDEDTFDEMTKALQSLPDTDGDGNPLPVRKTSRAIALTMLKAVVPKDKYTSLEKCTSGELDQALAEWTKHSQMSLGELLASADSSTSTGTPSEQTSSTEDGDEKTSESDSPGSTSET